MKLKDISGALFDLDGVLIDSEGQYSIFWAATGRKYGVGGDTFAADIKGTNLQEILGHFPEEVREEVRQGIHQFEHEMDYPLFPGALDLLRRLRAEGIPAAIVTSSDNLKMQLLFSRRPELREWVDAVITGEQVTNSKPDPEGYLRGAEAIGCQIERCVVFEDSMQGLEAGRRSGARVIGIATTNPRTKVAPLADEVYDAIGDVELF